MVTSIDRRNAGIRSGDGIRSHHGTRHLLGSPTHIHPFDQWIYLIGAEVFSDFDADIEFTFGEEVLKINYPCYIFVPKGTKHCPLDIKRVGKPLIFIDASITQEASVRPEKIPSVGTFLYIRR